ncbi:GntR family transcriptional regulator [Paracoccus sp. Z330]|uniref:GntR family transcriptional regulator n=1 Tax=Paracoccus onchidii TaxID=3017813 RepID=A0ABT4ZI35_9RHOB|nr:GntR family transcriptional regulator [Paracoccus onchidii]MDB6178395.1 GntR family transcriptional regulator [Paracoccus onchidii]
MNSQTGRPKLPDVLGLELADIIESRIIRLEFEPDTHLTEQQICAEFDVSRSPVREAFRQLEATGLVVRHKRRGVRVTPMSYRHVDEIYAVRIPLESIAATLATENATEDDLDYLADTVKQLKDALATDDAAGFFDANIAYFERLHSITGNATLQNILRAIEKQAMRYRYFAHRYSKEMQQSSTANLSRILDRMRDRDVEGARSDTEAMMMQAHKLIVDVLREYPALTKGVEPEQD